MPGAIHRPAAEETDVLLRGKMGRMGGGSSEKRHWIKKDLSGMLEDCK